MEIIERFRIRSIRFSKTRSEHLLPDGTEPGIKDIKLEDLNEILEQSGIKVTPHKLSNNEYMLKQGGGYNEGKFYIKLRDFSQHTPTTVGPNSLEIGIKCEIVYEGDDWYNGGIMIESSRSIIETIYANVKKSGE